MFSPRTRRRLLSLACLAAPIGPAAASLCVAADAPTTAPSADAPAATPARTEQQILMSLRATQGPLNEMIGDESVLADKAKREAVTEKVVPLLKQFDADMKELAGLRPQMLPQSKAMHFQVTQTLAVLGDSGAKAEIDAMAASPDSATALRGQSAKLAMRWTLAGRDGAAQTALADEIETLAKAHPESPALTLATARMSSTAATPALADRLTTLATGMKNPAAQQVQMMKAQEASAKALKDKEGKPFVVTGTTVDGKAFTTADWKGKVVLVDFWATWCGPCKAALPGVQQAYAELHDKGFEILGVSNDYSAEALKKFTADQKMPWPQLFDAAAAGQQSWNPVTLGFGVNAIPRMFVIDKKGLLRSSDAGENFAELVKKALAEES